MGNAVEIETVALSQVRMDFGQTIQLEVHDHTHARHFSSLYGYIDGDCIFVQIPVVSGRRVSLLPGQHFTVRLVSGVYLLEFEAHVLKFLTMPKSTMLLSFPKQVRRTSLKRRFQRVKVDLPVTVLKSPLEARLSKGFAFANLGAKGGALVGPRALGGANDRVQLEFEFPLASVLSNELIQLNGEIRLEPEQKLDAEGEVQFVHRVEFDHIQGRIQLLVYDLLWNMQHRK